VFESGLRQLFRPHHSGQVSDVAPQVDAHTPSGVEVDDSLFILLCSMLIVNVKI
jgi:hypothetical protein